MVNLRSRNGDHCKAACFFRKRLPGRLFARRTDAADGTWMRTLVIGDIHGCYAELLALLDKAGPASGDTIIAIGDIVDRGPESAQVLAFFGNQTVGCPTYSLMGNHERKHVRGMRHELRLAASQLITRAQLGKEYPAAVAFMASFPTRLELPEAILVHGCLQPAVPLDAQSEMVVCGTMGGEKLLRKLDDRPWYELYDGNKPVIVGHHDYQRNGQPFIYQDLIFGLDTSCVNGSMLTALLLPEFRILAVPSRGNLWSELRAQYSREQAVRRAFLPLQPRFDPAVPWDAQTEEALQSIMEFASDMHRRLFARLTDDETFCTLKPRMQAQAYATTVKEALGELGATRMPALMQVLRRGELDRTAARRILRYVTEVTRIAELIDSALQSSHCGSSAKIGIS